MPTSLPPWSNIHPLSLNGQIPFLLLWWLLHSLKVKLSACLSYLTPSSTSTTSAWVRWEFKLEAPTLCSSLFQVCMTASVGGRAPGPIVVMLWNWIKRVSIDHLPLCVVGVCKPLTERVSATCRNATRRTNRSEIMLNLFHNHSLGSFHVSTTAICYEISKNKYMQQHFCRNQFNPLWFCNVTTKTLPVFQECFMIDKLKQT